MLCHTAIEAGFGDANGSPVEKAGGGVQWEEGGVQWEEGGQKQQCG